MSVPIRQAHFVYARENQGLFINIVPARVVCSSRFSLKTLLDGSFKVLIFWDILSRQFFN